MAIKAEILSTKFSTASKVVSFRILSIQKNFKKSIYNSTEFSFLMIWLRKTNHNVPYSTSLHVFCPAQVVSIQIWKNLLYLESTPAGRCDSYSSAGSSKIKI